MEPHTAKRLVRALQLAAILSLSFAGCTCGGKPASAPPPTATIRPAATPTVAPRPADTIAPTSAPAQPAAAAPAQAPAAEQAAAPATRRPVEPGSVCEAYVAVRSGRKQDAAALAKPQVRSLGSADLIMCGAVFSDSDELCTGLMGIDQGPLGACLQMRSLFHELRAYPGKPSFMFSEFDWKQTRGIPALTAFADSLQQALRSGKVEECDKVGDGASICRAYMTLDKSLCTVTGKLAEVQFSLPDHKEGEPEQIKVKEVAEANCRQTIDDRKFLAKGLPALAATGPARERELAKAALQQENACDTYAQAALDLCANPPGETAPEAQTPAAGAPGGAGAPPAEGGGQPVGSERG